MNTPKSTEQPQQPSHSLPLYLRDQTERIAWAHHNRRIRRFAKILTGLVFILLCAGALVTGNKAALADPTWPKFVGQWYPTPQTFRGGLRYEDTHRIIAGTIGVLIVGLAFWVQKRDDRRWVRRVAWSAAVGVLLQAMLGGLVIWLLRGYNVSVYHATLGQAVFCLVLVVALANSKSWNRLAPNIQDPRGPRVMELSRWATTAVFVQLILGAIVRHTDATGGWFLTLLLIHISGAITVLWLMITMMILADRAFGKSAFFRRWNMAFAAALTLQVSLGGLAIFANLARPLDELPTWEHIIVATAHVAVGAAVLGSVLTYTMWVHRLLGPIPAEFRKHSVIEAGV